MMGTSWEEGGISEKEEFLAFSASEIYWRWVKNYWHFLIVYSIRQDSFLPWAPVSMISEEKKKNL